MDGCEQQLRTTITRHILVRRRLTCINKLQKKIGIFNSIVIYGSLKYLNNRHSLYIHICRCNNKCFITRAKYQQKYYPTNVCVFRHDCNKNDPTMRLIGSKKTNAINNNKKKINKHRPRNSLRYNIMLSKIRLKLQICAYGNRESAAQTFQTVFFFFF